MRLLRKGKKDEYATKTPSYKIPQRAYYRHFKFCEFLCFRVFPVLTGQVVAKKDFRSGFNNQINS